jgi:KUP system potassium uptake protein
LHRELGHDIARSERRREGADLLFSAARSENPTHAMADAPPSEIPAAPGGGPASESMAPTGTHRVPATGRALAALALGALGVVYGDIGTSPLYALKECFSGPHRVEPVPENVLGILSLVVWAITFVVTFKYLSFVMRADNRGEGGVLALLALVGGAARRLGRGVLIPVGLLGAALLYGDGVITPAISVLGAVEGVAVAAPNLDTAVVPIAVVILVALFVFQRKGTATVGRVFGPIMAVWFLCIFLTGVRGILYDASVLRALSPTYAVGFFLRNGWAGFWILGAVVLVITGGEALYADMGHFGRRPIRAAWLCIAMPALLVNYLGQGAMLLHDPGVARNPFYLMAPAWALYPLIAVATAAAIVASQALISGAFSLTQQAVQLGYSPRVTIRHTSHSEIGQIYIPEVNWALGVACVGLVFGFGSSSRLASAYGVAVTGTMIVTTLLFHRVMRDRWGWPRWWVWPLTLLFLTVDMSFFVANVVKFRDGGWFPLAAAAGVFTLMTTWKRGRETLARMLQNAGLPLEVFMADLHRKDVQRVQGTAVFMTSNVGTVPPVLLHHLKHNKVLHERVLLVSLLSEEIPYVRDSQRVTVKDLGRGFFQVIARYGFMETPPVPALLESLGRRSPTDGPVVVVKPMETTFYLGRETLLPVGSSKMAGWRKRLFIIMARNAQTASSFFGLPPNRVVEMGAQLEL